MKVDRAFWKSNAHKSGEQLARDFGGDGGTWRRKKRKAAEEYPELFGGSAAATTPLRGIAVYDLHFPLHDKKLWANILRFTADFDPDVFLFGGDNLDCEPLSHWVGNKRRVVEGKRMKKDYDGFNAEVLDALPIRDDVRRIFHLGNHEDWVQQYIDEHPEVEGFLEVENNLNLDGWEVYEPGQVSRIGKLYAIHGDYCNQHHAAKTVQTYGRSVMYGHTHTYQVHTAVTPLDSEAHAAINVPCACGLNPHYARNKPNAWSSGFAVFYVQPDGTFNVFVVHAVNGCFTAPTGVRYE